MPNQVKCLYCGKPFYKENTDYVTPQYRRYAHKECALGVEKIQWLAKNVLGDYYIEAVVNRNIKDFLSQGMTLEDIYGATDYWYNIQTHKETEPSASRGGIGIIPFILPEYRAYKKNQELKKRINKGKKIEDYVNKEGRNVIFSIPPIKKPRGMNFFELR